MFSVIGQVGLGFLGLSSVIINGLDYNYQLRSRKAGLFANREGSGGDEWELAGRLCGPKGTFSGETTTKGRSLLAVDPPRFSTLLILIHENEGDMGINLPS